MAPAFLTTWGCQLISYVISVFLYGIGSLLVAQYFKLHSQRDPKHIQWTIGILIFLATAEVLLFGWHAIYENLVNRFEDLATLNNIEFSGGTTILLIYMIACITQTFFVSRVWIITKHNLYLTMPIVILILLQISAGLVQVVSVFRLKEFSLLDSTVRVRSLQASATAACDVLITGVLCFVLHDARSGIKRTDSVIDKLIIYAVNRGAVTSIAALLNMIFFISTPKTFLYMIPLVTSGQLYVISAVSMLNSRPKLQAELNGTTTLNSYHLSTAPDERQLPVNFSGGDASSNYIHVQRSILAHTSENIIESKVPDLPKMPFATAV